MAINARIKGLNEIRAAIKRNPQRVLSLSRVFLQRGIAEYKRGILNSPWRIGGSGGGSPVSNDPRYARAYQKQRSGNLRDSHETKIRGLTAEIGPNTRLAPYAAYVHEGTGGGNIMQPRPWLDYVKKRKEGQIRKLQSNLLDDIVSDLVK